MYFADEVPCVRFEVYVKPDQGHWKGGTFKFDFTIPPDYPHKPPKVLCRTNIWHPNIDLEGNGIFVFRENDAFLTLLFASVPQHSSGGLEARIRGKSTI